MPKTLDLMVEKPKSEVEMLIIFVKKIICSRKNIWIIFWCGIKDKTLRPEEEKGIFKQIKVDL